MFDTVAWTTPGGDFTAAASASADVPDMNAVTWGSTPELVADVQAWVDDPSSNFGWIVIGNESARITAKRFASRQAPQAAQRPRLVIDFQSATAATPTPTVTPGTASCTGDCNGSGDVGINELITGVNIVLGSTPLSTCPSFDADGSGVVAINELIAAVNHALAGC